MDEMREGVTLAKAPGADVLQLTAQFGRSHEAGGAIKSQYAAELAAGDASVGAFAMYGCGRLLGGMTYGFHPIPTKPGRMSARIDVVVTIPEVRRLGTAAIVVSDFVLRVADGPEPEAHHISVIAQHPSIAHIVSSLGFEPANIGSAPLYQISLERGRGRLLQSASSLKTDRLSRLQARCRTCLAGGKRGAWCRRSQP